MNTKVEKTSVKPNENDLSLKMFDKPVEVSDRRTAFSKVYQTGPNMFQAVTYPNEVHTWDEKAQAYREIDNTFAEKNGILENRDNPALKVRLLAESVQLQSAAGHKLRWKINDLGMGSAEAVETAELLKERTEKLAASVCAKETVAPVFKSAVPEVKEKKAAAVVAGAEQVEIPGLSKDELAALRKKANPGEAAETRNLADCALTGEELAATLGVDLAAMAQMAADHLA